MLGILENIEENQRKSTKVGMTRRKSAKITSRDLLLEGAVS